MDAVRAGMARVVPMPLLMTFNAAQLETLVVGRPELDLGFLVGAASACISVSLLGLCVTL